MRRSQTGLLQIIWPDWQTACPITIPEGTNHFRLHSLRITINFFPTEQELRSIGELPYIPSTPMSDRLPLSETEILTYPLSQRRCLSYIYNRNIRVLPFEMSSRMLCEVVT